MLVAVAAASATVISGMDVEREREADKVFFDMSNWSDDEKDELLDHALAIHDMEKEKDIDWRRAISDEVGSVSSTGAEGRRRLLSEEEFLRAAEDEWDADFRRANDGQDRDTVASIGGNPANVRRRTGKVSLPKKQTKVSLRNNFQPRMDFRCIDDSPSNKVPCPPADLGSTCDKYKSNGSFLQCYDYCKPSFCCIHDSLSTTYSPSCAKTEPNCPSYFACYIIWWKLHDTIGPANYLRIVQDEPFYDATFDNILDDLEDDNEFFKQLFGHHFDTDDAPTDDTFEDPDNWL